MTCFNPIQGFDSAILTRTGKRGFTQNKDQAHRVKGVLQRRTVPCRKCEGCRYDYTREWAVRIMHEAQCNFDGVGLNCSFITLTYNDDFIPSYGSLDYFGDWSNHGGNWTDFLKRFRLAISPLKIRFFMIGEYGDINLRPHYHAIIFGYDFPDKYPFCDRNGNVIYRSPLLESLWTVPRGKPLAGVSLGYSSVGEVSFASAAYVAGYSQKKLIGQEYDGFDEIITEDGEVLFRPSPSKRYVRPCPINGSVVVSRERSLMSRRGGGIGKDWFDRFALTDMYTSYTLNIPSDISDSNVVIYKDSVHTNNGFIVRPPKYYDKLLERVNPELLENIKKSRQDHMSANAANFTPDILRQRRECLLAKLSNKKRSIGDVYK